MAGNKNFDVGFKAITSLYQFVCVTTKPPPPPSEFQSKSKNSQRLMVRLNFLATQTQQISTPQQNEAVTIQL